MKALVFDIGKTRTKVGLYEEGNLTIFQPVPTKQFCEQRQNFHSRVSDYLLKERKITLDKTVKLVFCIAGDVDDRKAIITNSDLKIMYDNFDGLNLKDCFQEVGRENIWALNDAKAAGIGVNRKLIEIPKPILAITLGTVVGVCYINNESNEFDYEWGGWGLFSVRLNRNVSCNELLGDSRFIPLQGSPNPAWAYTDRINLAVELLNEKAKNVHGAITKGVVFLGGNRSHIAADHLSKEKGYKYFIPDEDCSQKLPLWGGLHFAGII